MLFRNYKYLEYTKFSTWDQRHLACQAAVQVLGFNKQKFKRVDIKNEILENEKITNLLDFADYLTSTHNKDTRGRYIENQIKLVYPSRENKKKQSSKKRRIAICNKISPIPGIYRRVFNDRKFLPIKTRGLPKQTIVYNWP